jgi:CDP-paratose 2-epimerase
MRILITGGAGFVGASLARQFVAGTGAEVVAFDNLRRRGSELNLKVFRDLGIRFVHGDIRNFADLLAAGSGFDLFIDASAEPSVHSGVGEDPEYVVQTNLLGSFNCLKFARDNAKEFTFLSTSRVYSIAPLREIAVVEEPKRFAMKTEQTLSGVSPAGISEAFRTDSPRSLYGATKLSSEYLVQEFTAAYGLNTTIYRCGVIAGPGQFGRIDQGFCARWVAHHYFQKPLEYMGFGGKGKQVRDLLHPSDLFDLINRHRQVADRKAGSVYNVGGGREISVSLVELTEVCRRVVGKTVPVGQRPETALVDIPLFICDCTRISSEVAWRPVRGVDVIVADIFNWIRENETDLRPIFN